MAYYWSWLYRIINSLKFLKKKTLYFSKNIISRCSISIENCFASSRKVIIIWLNTTANDVFTSNKELENYG